MKGTSSLWPEVFLHDDLPSARLLLYTYDADVRATFLGLESVLTNRSCISGHRHRNVGLATMLRSLSPP